jgi:phage FluMu protein Com
MTFHFQPLCPTCQTVTMLARVTPGRWGFNIRTFECPECKDVHQIVADLADPMKSPRTNRRLEGQLRAPT